MAKGLPRWLCGRVLSAGELESIRREVRLAEPPVRAEVARRVSRVLGWTDARGRPKLMSCRVGLLRLHRGGWIELPAPRNGNGNGKGLSRQRVDWPAEVPVVGEVRELGGLHLAPVADQAASALWNGLIDRYHYLGYQPLPGAQLRYLIRWDGGVVGALGFGAAAWKVGVRDRWIGWDAVSREQHLDRVLNHARFLILPWVRVANLASKVLGLAARQVPGEFGERYGVRPVWLPTFVEAGRFAGTCYRAANWCYLGQTTGRGKLDREALPVKDVYVYPLKPRAFAARWGEPHERPGRGALCHRALSDARLNRRAQRTLEKLGAHPMESIPTACGGWAETLAAYRLFDHPKVTAQGVLEPHYACTEQRMRAHPRVLCIQDTTEGDYTGKNDIAGLGPLNYETRRGLYLHPTLALTPERVPLGLLDLWSWSREAGSLGRHQGCRPIEEKESLRWLEGYRRVSELIESMPDTHLVYVADREGDLYEVLAERAATQPCADWLIRAEHDRCLTDGGKLRARLGSAPVLAEAEFDLPATTKRPARRIHQQLRVARVTLKAPHRTDRTLADIEVTAVLAREVDPPKGEEPLEWWLPTSLPVETAEQALEKLQWYLCRWQIEVFFKVLKGGCRIEKLQLETIERLEPALAFYLIIAWRVLYLTMLGRDCPEMPCNVVFADEQWRAVYIVAKRQPPPDTPPSLNAMVRMVASFGGFLNRKGDGFPGPQSLWIGLQRTRDFVLAMDAQRASQGARYV